MIYAQYRFGAELLATMPPELQRSIGRFRQLYDMGLHGPELLSFIGQGQKFLQLSGEAFFERVCRAVRMDRSEGAMAYLYGLIAYYAFSSIARPYLRRSAQSLSLSPGKLATDFDRYLLDMDGKTPAFCYDRSRHVHLTPGECQTVAMFYPGITAGAVEKAVKRMAKILHAPAMPTGSRRDFVVKLMELTGEGDYVMNTRANRHLRSTNEGLMQLYRLALKHFPSLSDQVLIRLRKKVPFGPDFSLPLT